MRLLESNRKATRRRLTLDLKRGDIYPSEHHTSFTVERGDQQHVYVFGGSGFSTPNQWHANTELFCFSWTSDSEIYLNSISKVTVNNCPLPCLANASCVATPNSPDALAVSFGGVNLDQYMEISDLLIFKEGWLKRLSLFVLLKGFLFDTNMFLFSSCFVSAGVVSSRNVCDYLLVF